MTRCRGTRAAIAARGLVLAILLVAPETLASKVVLVRPSRPTSVAAEAAVRLRGELAAAGFDVEVVAPAIGGDTRTALEEAAAAPDVDAVVAIFGDAGNDSAELWVIDRVTGKTVVRRVPSETGSPRAAEVLSVRALELLRASFMEVGLASARTTADSPPPAPAPAPVTHLADAAIESASRAIDDRRRTVWAVEVGGCVLGSFEQLGPSLLPLVRIEAAPGERWLARMTLAGLGTRVHLDAPSGGADVAHQFGLVEGAVRFRPSRRLRPQLSLGAGALHVAAAGQGQWPVQGLSNSSWSFLFDVGAGARVSLRGRFELAFELHAQAAAPYPLIRFLDVELAKEGRPTWLGTLTLIAWI